MEKLSVDKSNYHGQLFTRLTVVTDDDYTRKR